tara:strand:- start:86899 stop:87153 length:255 start_codon:yes stop_codon:yes gene_type:complete
MLSGMSVPDKNELLFAKANLNFNEVPNWQKRGTGLYWESYSKEAQNPKTGEVAMATRKRLKRDMELPMKDAYSDFVQDLLEDNR